MIIAIRNQLKIDWPRVGRDLKRAGILFAVVLSLFASSKFIGLSFALLDDKAPRWDAVSMMLFASGACCYAGIKLFEALVRAAFHRAAPGDDEE